MNEPVIVLTFANDQDAHLDQLTAERKEILDALRHLEDRGFEDRGFIKLEHESSAEVTDVFDTFNRYEDRVAIFHYGGHANGTHLRFEGGKGSAKGLAELMGEQENLMLVFLNGCSTQGQVETMMEAGVKAVIATSVPIEDTKAREFAVQFYKALASRRTIEKAFTQAQRFLKTKYDVHFDDDIVPYRDIRRAKRPPAEAIPWGLYVRDEHRDEVLKWKLPYYVEVGLPNDLIQYIGESFKANLHIMLVLDEMTRYNPDIYHQMVEQRGGKTQPTDSSEYPHIIIKNFPWPIGSQIRLLKFKDRADDTRLRQLVSTYVVTSQVLYYILLSDLWEHRRRGSIRPPDGFDCGQPLDAAGFITFDFLERTLAIYQLFVDQGVSPYVLEYEKLYEAWNHEDQELKSYHNYLEALRGRLAEDPPTTGLANLCDTAEQAVSAVLRAAAFLANYRMLTVRTIMIQRPRFEQPEYELNMGRLNAPDHHKLSLLQDAFHRNKDNYSNSHSVVLTCDEDRLEDSLNLSPFIIDKNTFVQVQRTDRIEVDDSVHIFMMAYEEEGRLVYLVVDHSIDEALNKKGDKIDTTMTRDYYLQGRNLAEEHDHGLPPVPKQAKPVDKSPKVFEILQQQYDEFKADMQD